MALPISSPLAGSSFSIGIDLGGSWVRGLLADGGGREVASAVRATPRDRAADVVAVLVELSHGLCRDARIAWDEVVSVGIGIPGVADEETGALHLAPNLPSFDGIDLVATIEDELDVPVTADNDVNAATLAEHRHGHATDVDDFVFIAVGTGVGMGIVAGGQLVRGATGAAGEIAMLPLGGDPFDPANHVRGTLEEAAAGIGVAQRYAERRGTANPADPVDLFAAAAAGDEHAAAALDHQAESLALAVVAVHSVLDPALVVFGGGLGSRPELHGAVGAHLPRLTRRRIRLEASRLGERAGVLGAVELAREGAAQRTATGGQA